MPTQNSAPALAELAEPGWFDAPDLAGIGLVLAIVGSFLLANAILFRHPKALVREHFGRKPLHLRNIREYIFHRVQVTVGFGFLLAGFTMQLIGHYRPPQTPAGPFPTVWVGLVIVLAIVLLGCAWWWSLVAFRRYVRAYFLEFPAEFEVDTHLAREVGELFGVVSYGDDTVQSYVTRLRRHAGLPVGGRPKPQKNEELAEEDGDSLELEESLA